MLPLPESLSFHFPSPGPDSRSDAATARLIDEALLIRRQGGGDLGFFAAYRQLAEHKIANALVFEVLGRDVWRR